MNLQEYKKRRTAEFQKVTLCFLKQDNTVLLAMKKRGFGVGFWNGVGGKVGKDESVQQAAVREVKEEIGVDVKIQDLQQVGLLRFYFKDKDRLDNESYVYFINKWEGTPVESEEMAPKWVEFKDVPYSSMWEDDIFWLPQVLEGKKVDGEFLFLKHDGPGGYKLQEKKIVDVSY